MVKRKRVDRGRRVQTSSQAGYHTRAAKQGYQIIRLTSTDGKYFSITSNHHHKNQMWSAFFVFLGFFGFLNGVAVLNVGLWIRWGKADGG